MKYREFKYIDENSFGEEVQFLGYNKVDDEANWNKIWINGKLYIFSKEMLKHLIKLIAMNSVLVDEALEEIGFIVVEENQYE